MIVVSGTMSILSLTQQA